MKFNFRELTFKNLVLTVSLITAFVGILLVTSLTFAANRPTVVVFTTAWNAKCRTAIPNIESVVSTYGGAVNLQELDMDSSITPQKARAMGIRVPSTIPYVVVLDRNGSVVLEQSYNSQTTQQLKETLDSMVR